MQLRWLWCRMSLWKKSNHLDIWSQTIVGHLEPFLSKKHTSRLHRTITKPSRLHCLSNLILLVFHPLLSTQLSSMQCQQKKCIIWSETGWVLSGWKLEQARCTTVCSILFNSLSLSVVSGFSSSTDNASCRVVRAPSAMQMSFASFTLIRAPGGPAVGAEHHQPLKPLRYSFHQAREHQEEKLTWVQRLGHHTKEVLKAVINGKCSIVLFKAGHLNSRQKSNREERNNGIHASTYYLWKYLSANVTIRLINRWENK